MKYEMKYIVYGIYRKSQMIQEKMTKYDLCWNKNKNLAKKKSAFAIIENWMTFESWVDWWISNQWIYIYIDDESGRRKTKWGEMMVVLI